jgi:outer membrane receptor protein involved in Fe transport
MGDRIRRMAMIALLSLGAGSVWAQSQGGSLQGKVTDAGGQPVAGAVLQVSGPALQGFQGSSTDVEGQYVFPFLPVGTDYAVSVEAPGFGKVLRKGIEIRLGVTTSLGFTLSKGQTEIVVTAAAPIIDVKKTEVGANLSDKMISTIPLGRDAAGIAFLAPGAVSSGLANTPSISGASGPENSYTVNGVDVTSSLAGLNVVALNFDFIEATEVKTGGLDSEYGAFTGGTVNSITKSGGNEFHGGLFAYYFDDGLGAQENRLENPSLVDYRKSFKQYDVGGSLGGYFVKDKLWFFAAYDYNKTDVAYTANGTDANVFLNGRPSGSWAAPTGYKNTDKNPMYALKLTWNVSPSHKLAFSLFGNNDKNEYYRNLNNPNPTASPFTQKTDNYAASLQWNATWSPKFFTEMVISRRDTKLDNAPRNAAALDHWAYYYQVGGSGSTYAGYNGYEVIPTGPPNAYDPASGRIDLSSWAPSLGGQIHDHQKDTNDQLRLKATNLFSLWGRHELSYGVQIYNIHFDRNFNYTGPGFTESYPGDPFFGRTTSGGAIVRWQYGDSTYPNQYLFRVQGFMNDNNKKTKQTYTAYWAQDNWNLTDHFMVKVGLRLDQIHMKGNQNNLNVPDQILPGRGYSNGTPRSVNINDEWAPRLGFTWDVAHNNKSKLYGFWGIYYERIPNDMAVRALTDEYFHFSYFFDPGLTIPVPDPGYHYTYGFSNSLIEGDPGGGRLKGPYNEEVILGYQYEVRPDLNLGVRAVYRALGRVIEDISVDGAYTYIITNPDQWTNVWVPDALGRPGYWYRFPKPTRIYKALEITADKRFSNNWMMQGSYVLSRLQGNYEGLYNSSSEQLDPNITSLYDIPSLLINSYGLLPNDRTHVLKVYGGYFFSNIPLELSGNFSLQSGTPITALGADDAYGVNTGFSKVRGTAGRTPTIWALDLGAQYTFKVWKSNLALRADIFNVTNEQRTTTVEQTYNTVSTAPTQNYPYFKMPTSHQAARRVRLALRWTF